METFIAKWGFLVAAAIFLAVALLPNAGTVRVLFFVLAIAFFVIGAANARKYPRSND